MARRASAALALVVLLAAGASTTVVALVDREAPTPVHRSAALIDQVVDDLDDLDDPPLLAFLAGAATAIVTAIATVVRLVPHRAPAPVRVRSRSARGPPTR